MCTRAARLTRVFDPRLVFCIISRLCRFAAAQDLGNGPYYLAKNALPPASHLSMSQSPARKNSSRASASDFST